MKNIHHKGYETDIMKGGILMKYTAEEIRNALYNNELTAYYQPQYDTIKGQM